MIDKGTRLFPEYFDSSQMYYDDEPYAYWVSEPSINFCNWILYKEYNDYVSICHPNDCLSAISYEEVLEELRTYTFYEGMDREKLCKAFRHRSLYMKPEEARDWEDFVL
jgi:hypothetical protein